VEGGEQNREGKQESHVRKLCKRACQIERAEAEHEQLSLAEATLHCAEAACCAAAQLDILRRSPLAGCFWCAAPPPRGCR
jgi:hypothetical protein